MKLRKASLFILSSLLSFISCDEVPAVRLENPEPNEYAHIEGSAQKGPMIKGSQITAFVLDKNFKATGRSYPANISDDLGAFAIDVEAEAQYLELRAEGYYFNEVTGEVSESPIYLEAMGNSESDKLNINLFTTIIKPRIKKLLSKGQDYAEAVLTAQKEFIAALGIEDLRKNFTDIDITGTDKSDAVLLAFSCIIQQDRPIRETVSLIQNAASEFETEGKLTEKTTNAFLANRTNVDPFDIAHNIADYYSEKSIIGKSLPAFYKYLDEKYNKDFVIATGPMMDVSPETSMNYGAIESSCDILSDIEFDVECADEDVTVIKEQIIGTLYNVSIAVPENTAFEERTTTVVFKDKSGNELARREFKQDANIQYVELKLGSGTKSTVTIQEILNAMFEDGDVAGVNGSEYLLEVTSPDRAIVKLPRTSSYFFSFPSGSVSKADHIARVTVDIPTEVDASTPVPYYAGLESYHGMEIPNPATVSLKPAVAMLGIRPNGFDNISHIVISGNNDEDALSGTFTYVPDKDDLMYYPELNPETVKGTGKTITIRHADESGTFHALIPPVDFSNGFTVKVYNAADQVIGTNKTTTAFSFKAGQIVTLSFNRSGLQSNQICYTTSDGNPVELMERRSQLLPLVTSNSFDGNKGILLTQSELSYLPEDAFIGCANLTGVTLPECCEEIQPGAFVGCTSMQTFNIPDHIKNIGYASFEGCSSLHTFTGKFVSSDGRCLVNDGVLLAVAPSGLIKLEIEEGVKHLIRESLAYVSEMEVITLPSTLESIDNVVFHKNRSLKEIHCKSRTAPAIESMSFFNIDSAYEVAVYVPEGCKEVYSAWESKTGLHIYEEHNPSLNGK